MKLKKTKKKKRKILVSLARKLYRQGLTTREIGLKIGKSHTWVANVVKRKSLFKILINFLKKKSYD